ncbi:OapC/ArvC family zinc-ribbon domain-containing protein [Natrinema halophilum]|uniref:Zn-ribbon containing protein n=1 Tax=Natrinema halophilum TaxID=1699371 RepID=A0A7D5H3E4_9EURY|nr:Zn-ribbon containing protein [Natrinema halophilum]QLG49771.1 hypothetical protein HYG82_13335 [Natrinema halophilum]
MPHQCTNCGRTFADGSKEMLSGCPDCGGNKFQFAPTAAAATESFDEGGDSGSVTTSGKGDTAVDSAGSTDAAGSPERSASSASNSVTARAAETVREWVSADSSESPAEDPVAPAENSSRNGADSDEQHYSGPTTASSQPNGSWPTRGKAEDSEEKSTRTGEFPEWPETARRPEDRSGSSIDISDDDHEEQADPVADQSNPSPDASNPSLEDDENSAQANARSEVVPSDDIPTNSEATDRNRLERTTDTRGSVEMSGDTETSDVDGNDLPPEGGNDGQPPEHGRVVSEPSGDRPSIEDLRAELNEQFESIKIVRPGQYELNLMELYNRDEYIISLQEDGRYVIDVPDSWREGDDGDV